MQLMTNDKLRLVYNDTGKVGQPTIILIAGYSGIKEEWLLIQKKLTTQGWRVITFDCRNHGASSHGATGLRISRLAMDLANLMQKLSVTSAILLGHSMGASIIWSYISLFGTAKIIKIITIDQSPKALNTDDWHFGAFDITYKNLALKADMILTTSLTAQRVDETMWDLLKERHRCHPFNQQQTHPLLENHLVQDWRDVVMTIKIPHLMLLGGKSMIWGNKFNQYCQEKYQNNSTQVIILKESGHLPHLEEPLNFMAQVMAFINE